jgi:hypothetical protein
MKKDVIKEKIGEDNKLLHELDVPENSDTTMTRSRLKTHTKNNLILLALGAVALVVFLLFFGPQLLINLSLLVGDMRDEQETITEENEKGQVFIPQPIINTPVKATKESAVDLKGAAQNARTVELFVNDSLVDKETVNDDGFSFTKVPLKAGDNHIKARAIDGKNKSAFSESVRVVYREKAPELEIETPRDGDAFSGGVSILKVKGKTEPYAKVTVNGARAIIDDTGTFRYDYRMQGGDNKLMVITTDEADNKTEKEVKFTYSP